MTSGARQSRPVSSTIRMTLRGAACAAHRFQTPSVSSAVTEPARSAVVRLSDLDGGFPARAVVRPPCARAIAAVNAAGPRPTTTTDWLPSYSSGIEQSLRSRPNRLARASRIDDTIQGKPTEALHKRRELFFIQGFRRNILAEVGCNWEMFECAGPPNFMEKVTATPGR